MATVTIDIEVIENLIKALKPKDRIQLLKHFEDSLWKSELDEVTAKMRKRIKEKGITDREIDRICEEVRKERYAKNKGHS